MLTQELSQRGREPDGGLAAQNYFLFVDKMSWYSSKYLWAIVSRL
jgi:hypothetical protein